MDSTTRLNKVEEYDPGDLTIAVGAGIPFAEMQRQLGEHQQWVPCDAAHLDRATIGGLLATGAALWIVTATARSTISPPETSRYTYLGAVVIVLVGVELLRGAVLDEPPRLNNGQRRDLMLYTLGSINQRCRVHRDQLPADRDVQRPSDHRMNVPQARARQSLRGLGVVQRHQMSRT